MNCEPMAFKILCMPFFENIGLSKLIYAHDWFSPYFWRFPSFCSWIYAIKVVSILQKVVMRAKAFSLSLKVRVLLNTSFDFPRDIIGCHIQETSLVGGDVLNNPLKDI